MGMLDDDLHAAMSETQKIMRERGIPYEQAREIVLNGEPKAVINEITRDDVEGFKRYMRFETGIDLGNALDHYQRISTKSAIYPGKGTPLGLVYVALKGAGEAGEFAEHVGKAMRDDDLMRARGDDAPGWHSATVALTPERKAALIKEIGDELWYLAAKCNELNIRLSHAATVNLEKLCDRTERNALRGSGDER